MTETSSVPGSTIDRQPISPKIVTALSAQINSGDIFELDNHVDLQDKTIQRVLNIDGEYNFVFYENSTSVSLYDKDGKIVSEVDLENASFENALSSTLVRHRLETQRQIANNKFSLKAFFSEINIDSSEWDKLRANFESANRKTPSYATTKWNDDEAFVFDISELNDNVTLGNVLGENREECHKYPWGILTVSGNPYAFAATFVQYRDDKGNLLPVEEWKVVKCASKKEYEEKSKEIRKEAKISLENLFGKKIEGEQQYVGFTLKFPGKLVFRKDGLINRFSSLEVPVHNNCHDYYPGNRDVWGVLTSPTEVWIINTKKHRNAKRWIEQKIQLPEAADWFQLGPKQQYLIYRAGNKVKIFNIAKQKIEQVFDSITGDFDVDPDGNILVSNSENRVVKITTNLNEITDLSAEEIMELERENLGRIIDVDLFAQLPNPAQKAQAQAVEEEIMLNQMHQSFSQAIFEKYAPAIANADTFQKIQQLRDDLDQRTRLMTQESNANTAESITRTTYQAIEARQSKLIEAQAMAIATSVNNTLSKPLNAKILVHTHTSSISTLQGFTNLSPETKVVVSGTIDRFLQAERLFYETEAEALKGEIEKMVEQVRNELQALQSMNAFDAWHDEKLPVHLQTIDDQYNACPQSATGPREAILQVRKNIMKLVGSAEEVFRDHYDQVRGQVAADNERLRLQVEDEISNFIERVRNRHFPDRETAADYIERNAHNRRIKTLINKISQNDKSLGAELSEMLKVDIANLLYNIDLSSHGEVADDGRRMQKFGEKYFPISDISGRDPEILKAIPHMESNWVVGPQEEGYLEEMALYFQMQLELHEGILNLKGDTGTGKDVLLDIFCSKERGTSRPVFKFDCSRWDTEKTMSESVELSAENGVTETVLVPSSILRGIQTPGAMVYLNEFNALTEPAQKFLNALFDAKRSLTLKTQSGKRVKAHPTVLFACSMNPNYRGTNKINKDMRSRMTDLLIDYSPLMKPDASDQYSVSEALKIGRGVESFRTSTHEPDLERNEFVKIWDAVVNGEGEVPFPLNPTQQFDLEAILALSQFSDKIRVQFRANKATGRQKKDGTLPIEQPIGLRETRRCAFLLNQISDVDKLDADPEQVAKDLINKMYTAKIDDADDQDKIRDWLKGLTTEKRVN